MTIKEKYNSIDQSKLTAEQKGFLEKIKTVTKDFTVEDKAVNDKVETALDKMISAFKEKMPEAIKQKSTTNKTSTKSTNQGVKKQTAMALAKEIRKADESWNDAVKRANEIMRQNAKSATKTMKTEIQKLQDYIKEHKALHGMGKTDLLRDATRQALPSGRRVSHKGWKNQYGTSDGGKVYYENRENRKDRLAPNYPQGAPKFVNGGDFMSGVYAEEGAEVDYRHTYMLLSRLQQDCEYYLEYGNRNERHLWAGSVDGQIEEMKKLWNSLPKNAKPEWLSMQDILDYEKRMKNQYADGVMFEEPIGMMREVKGKTVSVPITDEISQSEINRFVDYVYESYEQDAVYQFTKPQVRKAVKKYLTQLESQYTWGGGDSLDRERVYEFLINPNLEEIKNPIFANGGDFMSGVYAEEGAEVDEEVTYFINKDGVKVRSVAKPEKELTKAEWMAKHNESPEAIAYGVGGGVSPLKKATYVSNRDIKSLTLVLKGQLKNIQGSDILDGVYVRNQKTSKKLNATEIYQKLKQLEDKNNDITVGFSESDVDALLKVGFNESDILNIFEGYTPDKLYADTEFGDTTSGLIKSTDDYQVKIIKSIVESAKEGMYEIGLKYPSFDWKAIVNKYNIDLKPKIVEVDNGYIIDRYEVYLGKGIALGHRVAYKYEKENWKQDYEEIGVLDLNKPTDFQKSRDYKAGFNGGYWGIVVKSKNDVYKITDILLAQKDGYVKDMELFDNRLGGVSYLDVKNEKFALGGGIFADTFTGTTGTHYTGLVVETNAMSSGEMFANGGAIKNQYEGRTPEDIWSNLTIDQRKHFLFDHHDEFPEKYQGYYVINALAEKNFDSLPKEVKFHFEIHVKTGQYANGGSIANQQLIADAHLRPAEMFGAEGIPAYKKGGAIKESDIKVGDKFLLANNEVVDIKRLFIENTDEQWVEFTRTSTYQPHMETSLKELKLFLNRLDAKRIILAEKGSEGIPAYKKGGALRRDRHYVNHFEDYEMSYKRKHPSSRHGYGNVSYAHGGFINMPKINSKKHKND